MSEPGIRGPRCGIRIQLSSEKGLELAIDFLSRHRPRRDIITVNAWNEWTEGSYPLPDTTHGLAYLEAIRDVIGVA